MFLNGIRLTIQEESMLRLRLLIFIALLFAFHALSEAAILLDRVVAVVNQEVITWSDLYKAMEFEASDRTKALKDDEKRRIFKENEAIFLESLIDMKLQIQAAKQMGMEVDKEDIDGALADIKKKYSMTEPVLIESLKKEGFTLDEYKQKIAEQILLNRVVVQQVRNKIVISAAEVEKYMTANKDLLVNDEAYRIRQIFFKITGSSSDRKAIEEKADAIIQQLKAGENFAPLAQKYSEDPSAKTGGDLGFIRKSSVAKEFSDILSEMKAGDISRPFWTGRGLHIVKLEEKINKQNEAEFKETVKSKLFEKRFSEKYKSWLRELRGNAYIEIRL